jgi:tryptophanyl-tRNA synthetase
MSIQTDSTPLEAPKNWKTCNCFAIYKLLATKEEVESMKTNYENGGYGYGQAKQELFELITEKFAIPRERYTYYMNHLDEIDNALAVGAEKAKSVADVVLKRVRSKLGY